MKESMKIQNSGTRKDKTALVVGMLTDKVDSPRSRIAHPVTSISGEKLFA